MASLKLAVSLLAALCALAPESEARATPQSSHYDAVVVEFASVGRANVDPPLEVVGRNWALYEKIVDDNRGADIVVFPEVGLTGMEVPTTRPLLRPLLSRVPDPAARPRPVPCDAPPAAPSVSDVVRNASCAARRNGVYLVINLPEEYPCRGEPDCPPDGFFIYNTNLIFDRTGTLIIRYRKTHLYVEPGFNSGREGQTPIFDSDFGVRFATFICFDIMYEDPPLRMVDMGITDIIHNSAWFSTPPFFTAIQLQANWAHAVNVTLMSSGLNRPSGSQTGSGIYFGDRGPMRTAFQRQLGTNVLRVRVPKRPKQPPAPKPSPPLPPAPTAPFSLTLPPPPPPPITSTVGQLLMFREDLRAWTTSLLPPAGGAFNTTLCHGSLCCRVEAQSEPPPPSASAARARPRYFYRAFVYDGMMDVAGLTALGEQACGVVACLNANDLLSCGGVDPRASAGLRFKRLSVRAAGFQRPRALQQPNTLAAETLVPLPADCFRFRAVAEDAARMRATISSTRHLDASVLTFAVHGRAFNRDRDFEAALPRL